jgi:hypothetical protein
MYIGSDSIGGAVGVIGNIPLYFYTVDGTERMRLTQAGKLGVGTTNPNGQLTVSSDQSSNNQHINIVGTQTSYSQEYSFGIPTSTKDLRIYDGTAGATRFTLTSGGSVGVGTSSPNARLHVQGPSGDGTATFRITSTSAADSFNYAGTLINGCLCSNRNYIFMIGQDLSNRNSGYIGYNHTGTTNSNNNFLTFGHFQSDTKEKAHSHKQTHTNSTQHHARVQDIAAVGFFDFGNHHAHGGADIRSNGC